MGYPPDQNLADRLARAGARVEVAPGDDGSGPGFFGFAGARHDRAHARAVRPLCCAAGALRRTARAAPAVRCERATEGRRRLPARRSRSVTSPAATRPSRSSRSSSSSSSTRSASPRRGTDAARVDAARAARHRQDPAGEGRRGGGRGALLRDVGLGLRRDLRRRGRGARARAVRRRPATQGGAIIFIDEIDAVGRRRRAAVRAANDEREQTLNQLLVAMDGFTGNERLLVHRRHQPARPAGPALLRPGRFDRQVASSLPEARAASRSCRCTPGASRWPTTSTSPPLAEVTRGSSGATCADAQRGRDHGRPRRARRGHPRGPLRGSPARARRPAQAPTSPRTADEREVVAWHEAGHALAAELCPTHEQTQRADDRAARPGRRPRPRRTLRPTRMHPAPAQCTSSWSPCSAAAPPSPRSRQRLLRRRQRPATRHAARPRQGVRDARLRRQRRAADRDRRPARTCRSPTRRARSSTRRSSA